MGCAVTTECVLTIDLGTTACKAMLISPTGDILAWSTVAYPTWRPDTERAEQHPDDWWEAASTAVRKVLASTGAAAGSVTAIGLSSQRETVVPLDASFRPLHSALLWMDTRGVEHVHKLVKRFGDQVQAWTGLVPNATYTAGKLLWFAAEHPDVMKATRYFLQPKDYLLFRMSGVVATDYTLASRTLLFNVRDLTWQPELMDACGVTPEHFPDVYSSETVIARLGNAVAAEWGLSAGVPIVLGGGDRASEVLGCGIQSGEIMESSGSTSNIACPVSAPVLRTAARVNCSVHVLPGQWVLEQGLSTTGTILDWWNTFGTKIDGFDDLVKGAESSPPGANGLIVLPFFMGTRAPRWNPDARGGILGLTLGHSFSDISRAILEGVGYELRFAIEVFEECGVPINRIRLIGGGALLTSWNQIKASIYKKWTAVPRVVHAASFGAFLLAARQLDWISSYEDGQKLNPLDAIYHPDTELTALYDTGYRLYSQLYTHLDEIWPMFSQYMRR